MYISVDFISKIVEERGLIHQFGFWLGLYLKNKLLLLLLLLYVIYVMISKRNCWVGFTFFFFFRGIILFQFYLKFGEKLLDLHI
jgi:hypothetical protein